MRDRRILVALGTAALAVVLFAVLRPGDENEAAPAPNAGTQPTTTERATTEQTTTAQTTTAATTTRPSAQTIHVSVRGGAVVGGIRRATIEQGRRVVLVVDADVVDHVHLHGYDIMRDVAPGAPARLAFRATVPGRFEVELEDRALHIAALVVQP